MGGKVKTKRVALCSLSGYDIISNPVMNMAMYLAGQGYDVDLLGIFSGKFQMPNFKNLNIHVHLDEIPQSKIPCSNFLKMFLYSRKKCSNNDYSFFVGFDPGGLKLASILAFLAHKPFVYHSLEIVSRNEIRRPAQWGRKWIEKILSRRALLCLTQDDMRAKILARENGIDEGKIAVVHNAPMGRPLTERSRFLRDKFGIPDDKKIILLAGSLISEHMALDIVESAAHWPDELILVMHGWFSNQDDEKKIRLAVSRNSRKIFISDEILPFERKYEIFQSADVGLAFYRPVNLNLEYVGLAAGKIFDFMRCGVPVITNNLPGMKEFVVDSGAGIAIPSPTDIPSAVAEIKSKNNIFSSAAVKCFLNYEYTRSCSVVISEIENMLKSKNL